MRQRKRHPLDVPTPVAVALADFCRRAAAPVDPRTVRDALSLLSPKQDEQVLELAGAEPRAKPLGPFAVVDMIETGATAHAAAERQLAGAFDRIELADLEDVALAPRRAEGAVERVEEPPHAEAPPKRKRTPKTTVEERVAPKVVRRAGEPPPAPKPQPARAPPRYSTFHKKNLPQPRGRFTRVDVIKQNSHKLLDTHMKEELERLIEQHGHRYAIRRALESSYAGKKGEPLSIAEVENALRHHELRRLIGERERTIVIAAVTETRGDLGRAAMMLGMKPDELDHVVLNAGAQQEIEKVREHHAREALAHGNIRFKLELMEKTKYLADLGVEKRFRDALALELSELLDKALDGATDVEALIREVARREALPYEKFKAAVDRTGLSAAYRRRLAS